MAFLDRTLDTWIWSDDLRASVRKRLREALGLALLIGAIIMMAALATWSVQDPSLSHATDAPVRNLLGRPGAIGADLLMQLFGLACVVFVLPVATWGWRISTHRRFDREWARLGLWLLGAILAAGFASCLPRSAGWPLPSGLGGVIGDALLTVPAWIAGPLSGAATTIAATLLGTAALVCAAIGAGFGWHAAESHEPVARRAAPVVEEEDDESEDRESRTALLAGWLVHGLLSLKARVTGLFASREPARRPHDSMRDGRIEPRLAPPITGPEEDEDFYDDSAEDFDAEEDDEAAQPAIPVQRAAPRKPARKAATARKGGYELPPLSILAAPRASDRFAPSDELIETTAKTLEGVLQDFGVRGEIINARSGPVVTLYELEPAPGIKSSRVIGLADDIARSMSAISARVAVVSGRNAIGIELPNDRREKVSFREMLAASDYTESQAKLPLCLGKTIGGEPVVVDLARMPHLLIAGTTGSGKSVAINTMILSLLYRLTPEQCRLIMVDPKMLELSVYDGIPHLLTPVVTDPKKAVVALKWAVREMEERYKKMSKLGVRNIDGFNNRVAEAKAKGEVLTRTVHTGFNKETGEAIYETEQLELEPLPYIVIVVDEMADLMMVAGKDIEGAVQRLAQMARAAGLHVILATQRPSVDVITGTIKANFPTRISFQVTSKIDSRTILGEQGAEQLLGQGDMLYMAGGGRISRVHGPFCSDEEVEKVVRHLKSQGTPQYLEAVTTPDEEDEDGNSVFDSTGMGQAGDATDLFQKAVQIVMRDQKASTSYIQRRLQIGYNRAASIMERMEQEGIVGQANHAGKREILVGQEEHESY